MQSYSDDLQIPSVVGVSGNLAHDAVYSCCSRSRKKFVQPAIQVHAVTTRQINLGYNRQ